MQLNLDQITQWNEGKSAYNQWAVIIQGTKRCGYLLESGETTYSELEVVPLTKDQASRLMCSEATSPFFGFVRLVAIDPYNNQKLPTIGGYL